MVLAGDIGGTRSRLRLLDSKSQQILAEKIYPSADFSSLEQVVLQFKQDCEITELRAACFGLAGPVVGRQVQLTNLPWWVDADELAASCQIQTVEIINDFTAAAYGVDGLTPADFIELQAGEFNPAGNRLVIGAGTGLGTAPVIQIDGKFYPQASEGGSMDFAPVNPQQQQILEWLWQAWPHVHYERLLSGPGISALHAFYSKQDPADNQAWLSAERVSQLANEGDACAVAALQMFVQIYGAFIGSLSLFWPATAGIYIAGGIAAKLESWIRAPDFLTAMHAKSRMHHLLTSYPVYLITNPALGLNGASLRALSI